MSYDPYYNPYQVAPPKKKKRIFLWFFLAVQIIFLIWIISGIAGVSNDTCDSLSAEDCTTAKQVGGSIGVFIIVFFWMMVDFILGVSYGIYKMARR